MADATSSSSDDSTDKNSLACPTFPFKSRLSGLHIYHNAGISLSLRSFLEALNHPQPPTPIKTDNSTATGFVYDNIHQKRSKTWDMRYYWLRDRQTQQQFDIYWDRGTNNIADYYTKHHATVDHCAKRPRYIKDKIQHLQSHLQKYHSIMHSRLCTARVS